MCQSGDGCVGKSGALVHWWLRLSLWVLCVVVGLCGCCVWLWACVGTVSGGCGPAVRWEGRKHPSSSPPALPQFTHENFSRKLREMFSTLVLNCDNVSCSAICDEFLKYLQNNFGHS